MGLGSGRLYRSGGRGAAGSMLAALYFRCAGPGEPEAVALRNWVWGKNLHITSD